MMKDNEKFNKRQLEAWWRLSNCFDDNDWLNKKELDNYRRNKNLMKRHWI